MGQMTGEMGVGEMGVGDLFYFCIKKIRGVWLLASPILNTRLPAKNDPAPPPREFCRHSLS